MTTTPDETMFRQRLARKIKAAMRKRQLGVRALARAASAPVGTLTDVLACRRPMRARLLLRVANALGVSTDSLLGKIPRKSKGAS